MDYHSLPRRQLQTLCKKHGIPANAANSEMADALTALLKPMSQLHADSSNQPGKRTTRRRELSLSETVSKSKDEESSNMNLPKATNSRKILEEEMNTKPQRATRGRASACAVIEASKSAALKTEKTPTNGETDSNSAAIQQETKKVSTRNGARKQSNTEMPTNAEENVNSKAVSPKSDMKKERTGGIVLRRGRVKVRSPGNLSKSPESGNMAKEVTVTTEEKVIGKTNRQSCLLDAKKTRKKKRSVTFSEVIQVNPAPVEHPSKVVKEPAKETMAEIPQGPHPNLPKNTNSACIAEKMVGTRKASRSVSKKDCVPDIIAAQADHQKGSKEAVTKVRKAEGLHTFDANVEIGGESDRQKSVPGKKISNSVGKAAAKENEEEKVADGFVKGAHIDDVPCTRRSRRLTIVPTDVDIQSTTENLKGQPKDHHEGNAIAPKKTEGALPAETSRRSRRKTLAPLELNHVQSNVGSVSEQMEKSVSKEKDTLSEGYASELKDEALEAQQMHSEIKICDSTVGGQEESVQLSHEDFIPEVEQFTMDGAKPATELCESVGAVEKELEINGQMNETCSVENSLPRATVVDCFMASPMLDHVQNSQLLESNSKNAFISGKKNEQVHISVLESPCLGPCELIFEGNGAGIGDPEIVEDGVDEDEADSIDVKNDLENIGGSVGMALDAQNGSEDLRELLDLGEGTTSKLSDKLTITEVAILGFSILAVKENSNECEAAREQDLQIVHLDSNFSNADLPQKQNNEGSVGSLEELDLGMVPAGDKIHLFSSDTLLKEGEPLHQLECEQDLMPSDASEQSKTKAIGEGQEVIQSESNAASLVSQVMASNTFEVDCCSTPRCIKDSGIAQLFNHERLDEVAPTLHCVEIESEQDLMLSDASEQSKTEAIEGLELIKSESNVESLVSQVMASNTFEGNHCSTPKCSKDSGIAQVFNHERLDEVAPTLHCVEIECEQDLMLSDASEQSKTEAIEGLELIKSESNVESLVSQVMASNTFEGDRCSTPKCSNDSGIAQVFNHESLDEVAQTLHSVEIESVNAQLEDPEKHLKESQSSEECNEDKETAAEHNVISREQSMKQMDLTLFSVRKLKRMCKRNQTTAKKKTENETPARKPSNLWMSATKQVHQPNSSMHPRDLPSANKRSALQALSSNVKATPSAAMQTPTAKVLQRPRNLMGTYDGNEGTGKQLVTPSPKAPMSSKRDFARSHHR